MFGMSLIQMLLYLQQEPLERDQTLKVILRDQCSLLSEGFDVVFEEALKAGATHVMLLADDVAFPKDAAHRLYAHKKRFVATNLRLKVAEEIYAAVDHDGNSITSAGKTGLEAVYNLSPALSMIDADVLRKFLPPRFEVKWNPATKRYRGEDRYFCDMLREGGEKLYIDHDLSKQVGHIGRVRYTVGGVLGYGR